MKVNRIMQRSVSPGRVAGTIIKYIVLTIFLVFFTFPIFWLLSSSIKNDIDIFALPPKLFSFTPTLDNFINIISDGHIPKLTLNSIIAATLNVILSLTIGTMAAYGISRFKVGGENLLYWFLSLRMLPPIVVSIPLFILASKLKLVDTKAILPIMYLLINVPFVVWMMKSFIDEIPISMEESALLDGCSFFQVLWKIIIPMIRSGLIATTVLCYIFAWNEFLLGMIFTRVKSVTLPVGISSFITVEQIFWGPLVASATFAALPPIILALVFQKYMVRGLTFGAVKH
jgi:multiple sugar transport system permease protein